jgi:putative peptidoglycan lipid II flippase
VRGYAGFIIVSRILGLIREALLARAYGTSAAAGALSVAQAVPNVARSIASEELAQAAVAPMLGGAEGRDDRSDDVRTALIISMLLSAGGALLATAMMLAAKPIADLIVPLSNPSYLEAVAKLLRRLAWMPALSGAAVGGMALLVVDRRLTRLAASIAATNLPIVAVLTFRPAVEVTVAAWAIVAGFMLQLIVVWTAGYHGSWAANPASANVRSARHEARAFASLGLAAVIVIGASSVSGVVDVAYATLVDAGAPAAFDRAYRLALVPFGLVAGSVGGRLVADLVRNGRSADADVAAVSAALRLGSWSLSGSALVLVVFGRDLVVLTFERGQWGPEATDLTTSALMGLAMSLPGLGLSVLASRAWTSMRRAWIPALAGLSGAALNVLLDHLLWAPFGLGGIGAATGAAHAFVGMALLAGYARSLGRSVRELLLAPAPSIVALAAGVSVWRLTPALGPLDSPVVDGILALILFTIVAFVVDRPVVAKLLRWGRHIPRR